MTGAQNTLEQRLHLKYLHITILLNKCLSYPCLVYLFIRSQQDLEMHCIGIIPLPSLREPQQIP